VRSFQYDAIVLPVLLVVLVVGVSIQSDTANQSASTFYSYRAMGSTEAIESPQDRSPALQKLIIVKQYRLIEHLQATIDKARCKGPRPEYLAYRLDTALDGYKLAVSDYNDIVAKGTSDAVFRQTGLPRHISLDAPLNRAHSLVR